MNVIINKVLVAAVFVISLSVLQIFSLALEVDRQRIISGQVWRLVTGHFVHTHIPHLLLNAIAALLLYSIFFARAKVTELLAWSIILSVSISVTLLSIYPELEWYNGLSGLLHALVTYFSVRFISLGDRRYWLALVILSIKVLAETLQLKIGIGARFDDMRVISEAHLVGVVLGASAALLFPGVSYCLGKARSRNCVRWRSWP